MAKCLFLGIIVLKVFVFVSRKSVSFSYSMPALVSDILRKAGVPFIRISDVQQYDLEIFLLPGVSCNGGLNDPEASHGSIGAMARTAKVIPLRKISRVAVMITSVALWIFARHSSPRVLEMMPTEF